MNRKAGDSSPDPVDLSWICRETIRAAFPRDNVGDFSARFYPYIGLTHTIRRRDGAWTVRISDHCRQAPRAVLEAIFILLWSKVLRRKPPREAQRTYEQFRRELVIQDSLETRRRARGRKRIDESRGMHVSLHEMFRNLNERFFNGQVEVEKLGWGPRRSWSRLGHYDPVHNTITISPVLDSPVVPGEVVEFIVYHEMLHALFQVDDPMAPRRRHHPPAFREAERAFPGFRRCEEFLRDFCARRGRVPRGPRAGPHRVPRLRSGL